jgi:hypothetical protein
LGGCHQPTPPRRPRRLPPPRRPKPPAPVAVRPVPVRPVSLRQAPAGPALPRIASPRIASPRIASTGPTPTMVSASKSRQPPRSPPTGRSAGSVRRSGVRVPGTFPPPARALLKGSNGHLTGGGMASDATSPVGEAPRGRRSERLIRSVVDMHRMAQRTHSFPLASSSATVAPGSSRPIAERKALNGSVVARSQHVCRRKRAVTFRCCSARSFRHTEHQFLDCSA